MNAIDKSPGVNAPEQGADNLPLTRSNFALRGFIGWGCCDCITWPGKRRHPANGGDRAFGCVVRVPVFGAGKSLCTATQSCVRALDYCASTGVAVLWSFGNAIRATGLAVGLVIALMELTRIVAGANLVAIMVAGKVKLTLLLAPILLGVSIVLVMTLAINNLYGRRWPVRWWRLPTRYLLASA